MLLSSLSAGQGAPTWLSSLLANEPTIASGLYEVESIEIIGNEADEILQATIKVKYLDIHAMPKEGKARLFVKHSALERKGGIPLMMFAHYECDPGGASSWCRKSWAVVTTHQNGEHCLGNSYNLDLALLEWVRRLPFVDRTKIAVSGGSAGGYMTLAMAAEGFPLTAVSADVPVLNWSYNVAFLVENIPVTTPRPVEGSDQPRSPIPVTHIVTPIATDAQKLFGENLAGSWWEALSPAAYTKRITCPVSMTYSTADMLVPIGQLSQNHFVRPRRGSMPEGFVVDFDCLARTETLRRPLLDVLEKSWVRVFVHRVPRTYHELDPDKLLAGEKPPPAPPPIDRPWDKDRQWSIVIFDEGAPTPRVGHFRYHFAQSPESFLAHYKEAPLRLEQLTLDKLVRLIERYQGKFSNSPLLRQEGPSQGKPVHRLNFPVLEQLDVVTGLLDYADQGEQFGKRLRRLYRQLEESHHAFGRAIRVTELRSARERLVEEVRQLTS